MSSSANNANGSSHSEHWRLRRPSNMRNGTFIVPLTGERSRQQFDLRTSVDIAAASSGDNSSDEADNEPPPDIKQGYLEILKQEAKEKAEAVWQWVNSEQGHGVLKCTFAYLLGSMGTFWPPLSDFLGHRDGKHVVATLTVYFNPARSAGSMLEAIAIAIIAVIYAVLVCLLSMLIVILGRKLDIVDAAHFLVLVVCIGGGLGFVGWVKQKMNQPLVNVGSTLTSIAIISVVTKEESIQDGYFSAVKIVQVLKMLVLGISFTSAINFLVWPVSARRVLRTAIVKASLALSDKLSIVSESFLNGSEEELKTKEYAQIRDSYNSAYSQITKMTREAKNEYYVVGREKLYQLDKALVKSVERLSQAIAGLRSALDTQFTLLKETPTGSQQILDNVPLVLSPQTSPKIPRTLSELFVAPIGDLSAINESDEDQKSQKNLPRPKSDPSLDQTPMFRYPSDIFAHFIELLGPSMKSLSYTLSEALRESPFGDDPIAHVKVNTQLRRSLQDALALYNEARGKALQDLYTSVELGRSRSEEIQADFEEVAAACGHFSFSLRAVAEEMDAYLLVLEDLQFVQESSNLSWNWLKFWKHFSFGRKKEGLRFTDPEQEELLPSQKVNRLKQSALPKGIPKQMISRRDTFNWDAAPHANRMKRAFSQKVLKLMRFLTREDIIFGVKVCIGAILYAQFAFIPSTRPIYETWRGEWGLLSYMIVVAMTTGASNTTSTSRFIGTLIGAACAVVAWIIGQENPFLLAFLGWLVALWNSYLIVVLNNASMGRICLLAYNVITLYAYSISQDVDDDDDDEGGTSPMIFDIAFHRVVSVTIGILWGMIFCRLVWPISARRKFREGLAVLYLQMGLIWKRGPLAVLKDSRSLPDYMREGEQAALQRYAYKLESLRTSAQAEFELRGPFPNASYARIMRSTKHILDGFYAMRLIGQKRAQLSEGECALLDFTAEEREQLCQRICHVFQVLASCIMLEYPLTDAIPTVDRNKDRLLGKIYQFRKDHMADRLINNGHAAIADESDYALLYAYTLVTAQVAEELKKVREEIEALFGVLHEESLLLE
ncbi:unnamed protein product [Clonostachys byssicola]|uniref:Integral membrane bound transporter domain-containing protein n=1 Tax=Clonostachys byssicola TaxID=160290 RepID=A0A9N9YDT9_9HYPO|nr:unnamed protein product [Clonostachys byssicola]